MQIGRILNENFDSDNTLKKEWSKCPTDIKVQRKNDCTPLPLYKGPNGGEEVLKLKQG